MCRVSPTPCSQGLGDLALLTGFSSSGRNEGTTKVLWQPGLLALRRRLPPRACVGGRGVRALDPGVPAPRMVFQALCYLPLSHVCAPVPRSPAGREGWANQGRIPGPPNSTCTLNSRKDGKKEIEYSGGVRESTAPQTSSGPCYVRELDVN